MHRVAIVGASGYSGAELAGILLGHPGVEIVGVYGSAKREAEGAAQPFAASWPRFRGRLEMPVRAASVAGIMEGRPDAVFLCTPHEASIDLAPGLVEAGAVVLDLSAAFRLKDATRYPAFYGFEHHRPDLLSSAVYGMPELSRAGLGEAGLVAVPGCYPTASILPLAPLVRAGAIARDERGVPRRPIIDAVSGVSGAGRKAEQRLLFCEVSSQAYGVLKHRHQPEIDAYAGVATVFTPHLGPFDRGILATIHVELAEGWTHDRVRGVYEAAYGREPFVRLCPPGVYPAVADVRGTNFCDLGLAVDEGARHLIVFAAIDNLVKGAAGQAVQCMNIRLGIDETTGLLPRGAGAGAVTTEARA